jgi:hypothetical protein
MKLKKNNETHLEAGTLRARLRLLAGSSRLLGDLLTSELRPEKEAKKVIIFESGFSFPVKSNENTTNPKYPIYLLPGALSVELKKRVAFPSSVFSRISIKQWKRTKRYIHDDIF